MSRASLPIVGVGNDFVVAQPRLRPAMPVPAPVSERIFIPVISMPTVEHHVFVPPAVTTHKKPSLVSRSVELFHRQSIIAFALLFLLVGTTGIQVGAAYWSAHLNAAAHSIVPAKPQAFTIISTDMVFKNDQIEAALQKVASQPATVAIGGQAVPIGADTIKSWIQTTPSADKKRIHTHVKAEAISTSINDMVGKYLKAPVNQVTATYADGSSAVIAHGVNGVKLTDPDGLKQQIAGIGENLMAAKGIQLNAPTEAQAFAAVTPAAFAKMIEVNVTTKQMYLYDNGQLSHTYPISAGAYETPTPLGQYKIYSKLPVQDMKGFNPNGTPYFQPHVRWINYFLPGGYAVHGNYWRPVSFFGNVNSSHGCVSLPDTQAKEVYDWAPLGTTVITHA